MTSGGWRQALWALLVPFSLVNLSQWMVPPATPDRAGLVVVAVLRALVRLVGLGLTIVLMTQWAVLAADIVAVQCLGQPGCLEAWKPVDLVRGHPFAIASIVLVALAAPVFIGSWITVQSRADIEASGSAGAERDAAGVKREVLDTPRRIGQMKAASAKPVPNIAAADFYQRRSAAPARTLHATVGLAVTAVVLSGGATPLPTTPAAVTWWVGVGLVAIGAVFAVCLDDPHGSGGRFSRGQWVTAALFDDHPARGLWWLAATADLVAAAYFSFMPMLRDPEPPWRDGLDALLQTLFVALAVLCIAALIAASGAAIRSGRAYFGADRGTPKQFRPWAFGIATAVVLPFAALLGAGLGVGMAETVRNCLTTACRPALVYKPPDVPNPVGIDLPTSYDAIALLWGITGLIVLAAGVVLTLAGMAVAAARRTFAPATLIQGRSMLVTWFFAGLKERADRILLGVVAVAVVAGAVSALAVPTRFKTYVDDTPWLEAILRWIGLVPLGNWMREESRSNWVSLLQSIGVLVLALIVIGLLYAIYNAFRRPDTSGRSLGVLWDLASFWPTEAHPLVPPCYARKAIRDITERVTEHLDERGDARVVLCGHSQGSLLMYATALRLAKRDEEDGTNRLSRVGLVTHGSQLQWAYGRAFPDMLSYFSHLLVMDTLKGRWQNLVRYTDPLGGAVLSWNRTAEGEHFLGDALPYRRTNDGERTTRREGVGWSSGAWVIGNERWLPDPVLHEPIFPPRAHSDYTLDAQWDAAVALAAGIPPHPDYDPATGLESKV